MNHFLLFGTHPRLSLAEYRALSKRNHSPVTMGAAALVDDPEWNGARLMARSGGIVKLGDIVKTIPIAEMNAGVLDGIVASVDGRPSFDFGFTSIGGTKAARRVLDRLPIELKRLLRSRGIKTRWVTSEGGSPLSPAAVAKLELTTKGFDFVLIAGDGSVHIGLTTHVQDADAWSRRDYGRPVRDDEAGMLPPKLARIMVNLAGLDPEREDAALLDPFCGSGTVLMEAALALRSKRIIGSDVSERQIRASEANMNWCMQEGILKSKDQNRFTFIAADVRTLGEHLENASIDTVVTEGHLGPPLKGGESQFALEKNKGEIERLWREALRALHPILKPGARLVLVWPSFKTDKGLARVDLDSELPDLGYRLVHPLEDWDGSTDPLVYHRPLQRIARRIVILEKA